jgi:hypothetical protein
MGVANGALGLARCFFPGVPVIPAGARQAAFAAVASVSASSAAPFGAVQAAAAGSGERRRRRGPRAPARCGAARVRALSGGVHDAGKAFGGLRRVEC